MKKIIALVFSTVMIFAYHSVFADNSNTVVAEVLGVPITEQQLAPPKELMNSLQKQYKGQELQNKIEEYKVEKLRSSINMPLIQKFIKDNHIVAPDADVENLDAALSKRERQRNKALPYANHPQIREVSKMMVLQWYIDKKMYEKYGGVVIWQQLNPEEPIGAFKTYFEEQNKKGAFKINNPIYQAGYWKPYVSEQTFIIPKERVDFTTPWWEKKDKK